MHRCTVLGLAIIAAAGAALMPISVAAAPVKAVIDACDNMDKQKPGSCKYETYTRSGLQGCTGNVCFDCPADGKRRCFALPGKSGNVGKTSLTSSGASVDDVVRACDEMDKQKAGSCKYTTYTRSGLAGCTGNVCFDCPADGSRECFAQPGKAGTIGNVSVPAKK